MLVLLLLVYLDIAILRNDVHIVNMSNENSIYNVQWYHIKSWHKKEDQVTLGRSPEFCLKCIIYMYLLETGHAPDDLPCGPRLVQES